MAANKNLKSDQTEADPKDTKKKHKKTAKQDRKIKQLEDTIERQQLELAEMNDKYLRIAAEIENFKKRKERESLIIIENAIRNLLLEVLPVIDDLERSLNTATKDKSYKSLKHGVELIHKKLLTALEKQGLSPIEAVDHPFDPELHEALMQVEREDKDQNIVVEEVLKGYRFGDKVIRHSKVVVNK
ncbi:MAG TPA: nucleotide exchange factor GrpE [bacterium]|nr:nucleotide exchange factor GrpE [bacterium]